MVAANTILGVDIGGTKVALALVSATGDMLRTFRYPIGESPAEDIPAVLFRHVDEFLDANPDLPPSGIGIGLKAMVGSDGSILRSSILKDVLPWDMRKAFEDRYRLPAWLDNDVHAATLAEIRFGAGRNHQDFIYVNIGTGTAAGIVSDGRLIRGWRNCAGELGVCLVRRTDGELIPMEGVVSGKGLAEEARRLSHAFPQNFPSEVPESSPTSGKDVLNLCKAKDAIAFAAINNFLSEMSLSLINLSLLLDPAVFVLGGGVMAEAGMLKQVEGQVLADSAHYGIPWAAKIELSALGVDEAGVLGAAAVWLDAMDRRILK